MKKNHTKSISKSKHLLVIRLSAMGDVALTIPVIRGVLDQNPGMQITVLTRNIFSPFFANIERLNVFHAELETRHKGISGLLRLFHELKKYADFECVIDLHSVIRSRVISFFFRLSGIKIYKLLKQRKIKKKYLKSKTEPALLHTINRYNLVFKRSGYDTIPRHIPVIESTKESELSVDNFLIQHSLDDCKLVGIAPFAKHSLKIWPQHHLEGLLRHLNKHKEIKIILFGGGKAENDKLNQLGTKFQNCFVHKLSLSAELALMKKLDVMLSMDSSNMHLASLSGVTVFSIWGSTHPGIGFSAWNQPDENTIQISKDELVCRPCTIYGKGECKRGDFACMERISSELVYNKIIDLLFHRSNSLSE